MTFAITKREYTQDSGTNGTAVLQTGIFHVQSALAQNSERIVVRVECLPKAIGHDMTLRKKTRGYSITKHDVSAVVYNMA